jgi:aspartate racemase
MKRLGVLGGMGPAAGAEFLVRLTQQTPAACDQEHIPVILWSDPTVPDRSTSLLNKDDLPWEYLRRGIQGLKNADCDHIVIPCNTAHFWYDRLVELGVPITHIVDSVADELRAQEITGTIGILGTRATMQLGLYSNRLNAQGWQCITPTSKEMEDYVQPGIDLIKANRPISANGMLMTAVRSLIKRGANAIVLGCTEIPLVIKDHHCETIPLINSIDSLVISAIQEFKKENNCKIVQFNSNPK